MKVRVYRVDGELASEAGMAAAAQADTDTVAQEGVGEGTSALLGRDVTLDVAGWPGSGTLQFVLHAATDDILHVGDRVKWSLPALTLWDWLYPGGETPSLDQIQKLAATVKVTAEDEGKPLSTQEAGTVSFSGAELYDARIETSAVVIPSGTDTLRFALDLTDTSSGTKADFGQDQIAQRPVFGGALPSKTLLFDSTPAFRQRVIEGGDPVAGASVLLAYSDWRADAVVDASWIDRQIGTTVSGGRMGLQTIPLYGQLVHEVTYGVSFDDGQGWRPEAPLSPNTASRLLGPYRTCFEGELEIPATATRMSIYWHVRTTLLVSYPGGSNVVRWYNEGDKLLRADRYDNPGGQPFVNYEFPVES